MSDIDFTSLWLLSTQSEPLFEFDGFSNFFSMPACQVKNVSNFLLETGNSTVTPVVSDLHSEPYGAGARDSEFSPPSFLRSFLLLSNQYTYAPSDPHIPGLHCHS